MNVKKHWYPVATILGVFIIAPLMAKVAMSAGSSPADVTQAAKLATASPSNVVMYPVGDYITASLTWFRDIAITLVMFLIAKFGSPAVKYFVTDKMVARGVDYAISAIEGAAKGQVLKVTSTNNFVYMAEKFVQENLPVFWKQDSLNLKRLILSEMAKFGMTPEMSLHASQFPLNPTTVGKPPVIPPQVNS